MKKTKFWQSITFPCPSENTENIEQFLFETLHACAVTYEDAEDNPVFEPLLNETPLWPKTQITALFEDTIDLTQTQQQLCEHKAFSLQLDAIRSARFEEQDWTRTWMIHYKPLQLTDNLWICPSWETPPNPQATNLILDPGLAFGSGTHPTTQLCLQWLSNHLNTFREPITIVDYGCGSGVLAIAALKLILSHTNTKATTQAPHAFAIDYDPQALLATQQNALRNEIPADQLSIAHTLPPTIQASIVIANIISSALITLKTTLISALKPKGLLVLSGILRTQVDAILLAFQSDIEFKTPICESNQPSEWVLLYGYRKNTH